MPASRLGILTAGGDCAGLNAVIRGLVCAAAQRQMEVIGFAEGYEGLLEPARAKTLTPDNTRGIAATVGLMRPGPIGCHDGSLAEDCSSDGVLGHQRI
jgi:6-phosphofructokinase